MSTESRGTAAGTTKEGPAPERTGRTRPRTLALILGFVVAVCALLSLRVGSGGAYALSECWQGLLAMLGVGEPLSLSQQVIVELRVQRVLVSIGVGAGLALSGGLLQGVFRNELASPTIIGVTSGASLGAAIAILILGGYGGFFFSEGLAGSGPLFVSVAAFLGALIVTFAVTLLATTGGRISIPTLLLVGIALNAIIGGAIAAIQSIVLEASDLTRALMSWSFGTVDDRAPEQIWILWAGLVVCAAVIPFVAFELDLFAGGEDDAAGLGVDTVRVKVLALCAAALSAGLAVAVAGQIAFVGLIVPHILRMLSGASHKTLLPLCLLGGPAFLLGADLLQRWCLGDSYLQPGVVMALCGGPFFLFLLLRNRSRLQAW